ncbi:hypothetical protein L6164_000198 [Bauhinia variegata]|uniref:Uncharacterized protein n=1 Tax=Bauhinia variegata TaxID=167791 RepID=A0ACB9Q781_BAUVA|nr:hypothetical protein L6164_000198 [Bauhinia variegata]
MEAEEAVRQPEARGRHLKKRCLKNKALAVGFNEKDLRDYVTGFHKRKKKRRKEAQRQQEEAQRRKRSEERKKRKLEKEFALYGGMPPTSGSEPDEINEDQEDKEDSIAGTKTYENDDLKVTVVTSEISREDAESYAGERKETAAAVFQSDRATDKKPKSVPINKKKPFKKVAKHRSQPKPRSKRDKRKGKKRGKK